MKLVPDLHNISKPFGLCGEAVQEALKKAYNGKEWSKSNVEYFNNDSWSKTTLGGATSAFTYRLVPKEEVVEVTMKEVCDKFGKEVKIKKD